MGSWWDDADAKTRRWSVVVGFAALVALLALTPSGLAFPIHTPSYDGRLGPAQFADWMFLSSLAYLAGLLALAVATKVRGHDFKRAEHDAVFAIGAFMAVGASGFVEAVVGLGASIVAWLNSSSGLAVVLTVFISVGCAMGILVHRDD